MAIIWFCFFHHRDPECRLSEPDHHRLIATLGGCPDLRKAFIHTPSSVSHPYSGEHSAPTMALELEFATIADCEGNLCDNTDLLQLAEPEFLQSLAGADISQQGMLARIFPLAHSNDDSDGASACSYLVHYPGPAEDEQAWLNHYVGSHAGIMGKLPGIRVAAVYTPAVVISRLPFPFASAMLRNKVVFDSAEALSEALSSPVRQELRADVEAFPAYSGGSSHVPMNTTIVPGTLACDRKASR